MHFSKTYAELLLTLPPALRDNAIEYRRLKKLLNKIVHDLAVLGLSPEVLQQLLETADHSSSSTAIDSQESDDNGALSEHSGTDENTPFPKVVYEFSASSQGVAPHLRLLVKDSGHTAAFQDWEGSKHPDLVEGENDLSHGQESPIDSSQHSRTSLIWTLQRRSPPLPRTEENPPVGLEDLCLGMTGGTRRENTRELVIPLVSNTAFFELLSNTLQAIAAYLLAVHDEFISSLKELSREISLSARPVSSTSSFHPHSRATSDPSSIHIPTHALSFSKSDLYSWREIFQLYVESEVFESFTEANRGARTVEDAEERLALFAERVTQRGLGDQRKLRLKESREALETFLQLNVFILHVKKFQYANAEATRKILKKHAKRTSLPLPSSDNNPSQPRYPSEVVFFRKDSTSLSHTLVQAVGEILLPIIPHVDDYSCLICTSIAFKPIRLLCGHFFCVRCLVKMQKRGKGNCPMCRSPTVLTANRSNVDWALVNFMQDWFPIEARAKQKENESEAAKEEQQELGFRSDACIIG